MALIKPIIYTLFDAEKFKVIYFSFSRRYNYLQKKSPIEELNSTEYGNSIK